MMDAMREEHKYRRFGVASDLNYMNKKKKKNRAQIYARDVGEVMEVWNEHVAVISKGCSPLTRFVCTRTQSVASTRLSTIASTVVHLASMLLLLFGKW